MMSMSGGWFFVVASEAISVGNTTIKLPGIGSYLALAIEERRVDAVIAAVAAMSVVILLYDQLLFRPVVAWASKFRVELSASQIVEESWVLRIFQRARGFRFLARSISRRLMRYAFLRLELPVTFQRGETVSTRLSRVMDVAWFTAIELATAWSAWKIAAFVSTELSWSDLLETIGLTSLTLLRVVTLLVLATVFWVPVSVWIGLRPRVAERVQPVAQFLAAFPANVLFPIAVMGIVRFQLNPDIWLSPLIIFGTQWYIVFNVIAGASAFPNDLKEAALTFRSKGWQWWRRGYSAGHLPLLRHRSPDGVWRLVERQYRRRVCALGPRQGCRPWHWRLHRAGDGGGRLSANRSRRNRNVRVRHSLQSALLAPALCVRRAETAFGLKERSMLTATATPLLEVRHLNQCYRKGSGESGAPILDDVNLTLNQGEIVGLPGRSGCGKSSLQRIVSGLMPAELWER